MNSSQIGIFVLIDALGWKVLEERSFLEKWLPYRKPLRTVLGYSSGAIPTILTGLPPAGHGQWNLMYYDPASSPFRWLKPLALLPDVFTDNRLVKKAVKETARRFLGMGPQFECSVSPSLLPYFNWVEKRNIYGPHGVDGARTIFDQLAERRIPKHVYSYHQGSDQALLEHAKRDLNSGSKGFHFLYLCEFDAFLHEHCQDAALATERLRWYEEQLLDLFELALRWDSHARYAVFSDHGMTPIHRHYDLKEVIDRAGFRMPQDYLAVYDSTMARLWFFNEKARTAILEALRSLDCGRLIPQEELKELGVWFADGRYGQEVFLLEPGCLLTKSKGARWVPRGMHGYHPDDPHSDAVFLSSEQPASPPHDIADLYGLMREFALPEYQHAVHTNLST